MMKRSSGLRASSLALLCAGVLGGCSTQGYGTASPYERDMVQTVKVVMPANAPSIFQQFRVRRNSVTNPSFTADHEGIDIGAPVGTPVIAAAPGRVVASFVEPMYGNRVVIEHNTVGGPTRTVYKHLNSRLVRVGQPVARGQQIGTLGLTGVLAGGIPHLHFEVRRRLGSAGMTAVDPHLFWASGKGFVTCFEPGLVMEDGAFKTTYPVVCKPGAVLRDADGQRSTPPTGAWVDELFDEPQSDATAEPPAI